MDFKLVRYKGEVIPIVRDDDGRTLHGSINERVVAQTDREMVWNLPAEEIPQDHYLMVGDNRDGLMHDKFIIIDKSEVCIGSMNFTDGGTYDDNNNLIRIYSLKMAEN